MSARKICTCDNCGVEKQTPESYSQKPEDWLLSFLFDGSEKLACSLDCAIALTKKSIEVLEKKKLTPRGRFYESVDQLDPDSGSDP